MTEKILLECGATWSDDLGEVGCSLACGHSGAHMALCCTGLDDLTYPDEDIAQIWDDNGIEYTYKEYGFPDEMPYPNKKESKL